MLAAGAAFSLALVPAAYAAQESPAATAAAPPRSAAAAPADPAAPAGKDHAQPDLAALAARLEQMQQELQRLGNVVADNSTNLAEVTRQHQLVVERLAALSQQVAQLQSDQQHTTQRLQDVGVQLEQLVQDQRLISSQARDFGQQLEQIFSDVGETRQLRFDNIQDGQAREDFRKLVDATAPRFGVLVIENKMDSGQYVLVNRKEYYLRAGEVVRLEAPTGTVSTQLPGQAIIDWTLASPDYLQSIAIRPQPPTYYGTSSTVVYGSPMYVEPPLYFGSSAIEAYRY